MAVRKKATKKVAKKKATRKKAPTKKVEAQPAPNRTKVFICDKPFYIDKEKAASMILFEAATRGMDKEQFSDFVARYGVTIELWHDATSNLKVVLCNGQEVLGDWI